MKIFSFRVTADFSWGERLKRYACATGDLFLGPCCTGPARPRNPLRGRRREVGIGKRRADVFAYTLPQVGRYRMHLIDNGWATVHYREHIVQIVTRQESRRNRKTFADD